MGTKISQLSVRTPADGTEYIECIIQPYTPGTNRRITTQDIADLAGDEHFKGVYISEAALVSAHATAEPGDYAYVDAGVANPTELWLWDDDDEEWVQTGSAALPTAAQVTFTPAGNISATDVQAALEALGNANIDRASSALTDSSTIAITGTKHTLTSAEAAVTWSYTFTGEEMKVLITLNLDAADYTFPSGTLCIVDGDATGDNTAPLFGISGDKYLLVVTKFGSAYVAVIKNIGQ